MKFSTSWSRTKMSRNWPLFVTVKVPPTRPALKFCIELRVNSDITATVLMIIQFAISMEKLPKTLSNAIED